jgi:hypothetical protein
MSSNHAQVLEILQTYEVLRLSAREIALAALGILQHGSSVLYFQQGLMITQYAS